MDMVVHGVDTKHREVFMTVAGTRLVEGVEGQGKFQTSVFFKEDQPAEIMLRVDDADIPLEDPRILLGKADRERIVRVADRAWGMRTGVFRKSLTVAVEWKDRGAATERYEISAEGAAYLWNVLTLANPDMDPSVDEDIFDPGAVDEARGLLRFLTEALGTEMDYPSEDKKMDETLWDRMPVKSVLILQRTSRMLNGGSVGGAQMGGRENVDVIFKGAHTEKDIGKATRNVFLNMGLDLSKLRLFLPKTVNRSKENTLATYSARHLLEPGGNGPAADDRPSDAVGMGHAP